MPPSDIVIKGAREHNLRNVDLVLPRNELICFSGVSGSGKSSMAFDTLFAEGQRRYVESLSSYARQFVGQLPKPDVEFIGGLSPAISISQKAAGNNPRSTVGTMTEIYDFLRILYARIGKGFCPKCQCSIQAQSKAEVIERIMSLKDGLPLLILAPVAQNKKGEHRELFEDLLKQGFVRARVDGEVVRISGNLNLDKKKRHNIEVLIDKVKVSQSMRGPISEVLEHALTVGKGSLLAIIDDQDDETSKKNSLSQQVATETSLILEKPVSPDDPEASPELLEELNQAKIQSQQRRLVEEENESEEDEEEDESGSEASSEDEHASDIAKNSTKDWPEGWDNGQRLFSISYSCPSCGTGFPFPTPQMFSFNSPQGMCVNCKGMGELFTFKEGLLVTDQSKSVSEGCFDPLGDFEGLGRWRQHIFQGMADTIEKNEGLDDGYLLGTAWKDLPKKYRKIWMYGTGDTKITYTWNGGAKPMDYSGKFEGVVAELDSQYQKLKTAASKSKFEAYMANITCHSCNGQRLAAQPRNVLLKCGTAPWSDRENGVSLPEVCSMSISQATQFFSGLILTDIEKKIASDALKEVQNRLRFLLEVGLSYLALDRTAPTLSGGESQRIRLAGQIGASLVGVLYILDEPSIGLHPRDNDRLIEALTRLRDLGNTVVVVEHDEDTMLASDRIVDFGPGPGNRGGYVVAEGGPKEVMAIEESKTGGFLSGRLQIETPAERRQVDPERKVTITGARQNNLKNVSVDIPLGCLVCVTGVSGSGKSSLIGDILVEALRRDLNHGNGSPGDHDSIEGLQFLDKLIAIDQSPIGRTPRSNPGTYIKVFDEIRKLYAQLPESKARGFDAGRFSFNVAGGRCEACQGNGANKLEMDFLADIWVTCPVCQGKRFNRETLQVKFKEYDIAQVLQMEIKQACELFENQPKIIKRLRTLQSVGLEYLQLGQPSPTLSGGEAQRIKLAKELSKVGTGKTLYLLDEPTTGLHFADIQLLADVLQSFVAAGNTVLVVEHNLDLIKTADWIIDVGPEGGAGGGEVLAQGTPEDVAKVENSYTGQALARLLKRDSERQPVTLSPKKAAKKKARPAPVIATKIDVEGAQQNNLRTVSLSVPRDKMSVFCGPSGSGKSSMAMDTIYAEGQRRYVESLSSYARQFVGQLPKPKIQRIEGLSPAIAIQQRALSATPRSTVGTVTEIYDYFRVLFSRLGTPYCPECEIPIGTQTTDQIVDKIMQHPQGSRLYLLAPIDLDPGQSYEELWEGLRRDGYIRIRIDGNTYSLENVPTLNMSRTYKIEVGIDRLVVDSERRTRIADSVQAALNLGSGIAVIAYPHENWPEPKWKTVTHSQHLACSKCGTSFEPLSPHHFSFNSPLGWCPDCEGLGTQTGADPSQMIGDEKMTLREGAILLWPDQAHDVAMAMMEALGNQTGLPLDTPLNELTARQKRVVFYGAGNEWIAVTNAKTGRPWFAFQYLGLFPALEASSRRLPSLRARLQSLIDEVECAFCGGSRLRADASVVQFNHLTMGAACGLPLKTLHHKISNWDIDPQQKKVAGEILREIGDRVQFLNDVGLGYLSLGRAANTLSGGESQRIRLASQLGSGLCGVLYVLDEPTIGLHPRDNRRLLDAMKRLRDLGNTLLVVEHDKDVIAEADYICDFGPGAGSLGGDIVAEGDPEKIGKTKTSVTGPYLSGKKSIPIPSNRRPGLAAFDQPKDLSNAPIAGAIEIQGARHNNLKDVRAAIPLGAFTVVTGVSGCGKSSLINGVLFAALARRLHRATTTPGLHSRIAGAANIDKVIRVDQRPIGNTPTSNPATYTGVFEMIRNLYAQLPESKLRGYTARRFSFNVAGGRCETCEGTGQKRIEMHFLPDVWVPCETCNGQRYCEEVLQIRYQDKSINDVLNMTCGEAVKLFENIPKIRHVIQTLADVGLDYLCLGQSATTLSGGEAQRVKLASELARPDTGRTLYLLDEPTTGLHFDDIAKLLDVLQRLTDMGNTVVVIEHNIDVIKCADWVLDLGPDAGIEGGEVVFAGTPEDLVRYTIMAEKEIPALENSPFSDVSDKFRSGKASKKLLKKITTISKPKLAKSEKESAESEGKSKNGEPEIDINWRRSYTGLALAQVLEEDPYEFRRHHDPTTNAKIRDTDMDIEEAGASVAMPWETDGKRWHLENRVARDGSPCKWSGEMLKTLVEKIEEYGRYGDTKWNHASVVEIPFERSDGWFFRASTNDKYLLTVHFRVRPKTFVPGELIPSLGLKLLSEIKEVPRRRDSSRVKVSRARGPSQEIEIRLYSVAEIMHPGFQQFLDSALQEGAGLYRPRRRYEVHDTDVSATAHLTAAQMAALQEQENRDAEKLKDQEESNSAGEENDNRFYTEKTMAEEYSLDGEEVKPNLEDTVPRGTKKWHTSRCGFRDPERVKWNSDAIEDLLEMLEDALPGVDFDFQKERQIQIRLPKQHKPWMTIESKERPAIRINWNLANDTIQPERLAELKTPGRMVTAGLVDRVTLLIATSEEAKASNLRSLIEHAYSNSC